jgi:hypothetical protein
VLWSTANTKWAAGVVGTVVGWGKGGIKVVVEVGGRNFGIDPDQLRPSSAASTTGGGGAAASARPSSSACDSDEVDSDDDNLVLTTAQIVDYDDADDNEEGISCLVKYYVDEGKYSMRWLHGPAAIIRHITPDPTDGFSGGDTHGGTSGGGSGGFEDDDYTSGCGVDFGHGGGGDGGGGGGQATATHNTFRSDSAEVAAELGISRTDARTMIAAGIIDVAAITGVASGDGTPNTESSKHEPAAATAADVAVLNREKAEQAHHVDNCALEASVVEADHAAQLAAEKPTEATTSPDNCQ